MRRNRMNSDWGQGCCARDPSAMFLSSGSMSLCRVSASMATSRRGLTLDRLMKPWPVRWDEQVAELFGPESGHGRFRHG